MGAISPMATEERMVGRKVIEKHAHQGFYVLPYSRAL